MTLVRAGLFEDREPRTGRRLYGQGNGGERFVGVAARASGGEAHDRLTETFAAVPQKRPAPARKERW